MKPEKNTKNKKIDARIYDDVFGTIKKRHLDFLQMQEDKSDDFHAESRTIRFFQAGVSKIAQKLGEEAVETLIEGVRGRKQPLIEESADLLYFLAILWAANDVKPRQIWKELAKRHNLPEAQERAGRQSSGLKDGKKEKA